MSPHQFHILPAQRRYLEKGWFAASLLIACALTVLALVSIALGVPAPVAAGYTQVPAVRDDPRMLDGSVQPRAPYIPGQAHFPGLAAPATITENNWTNLFPILSTVSAASTTEAWVRGENQGELLHFTAGAWTTVTPTVLSGLYIGDIQMLSATDGWLTAYSSAAYHAFQYDGTTWHERSAGLSANLGAYNLAVVSDSNIWATGTKCSSPTTCSSSLLHWNGTTWAAAGPVLGSTVYLYDVTLAGATVGWAVGANNATNSGVAYRYNGTTWTLTSPPADCQYLQRVGAGASGEAWAVGVNSNYYRQLYHYHGGTWTEQATPDGSEPRGIFMLSPTQGWLATSNGVLKWNGTAWTGDYTGRSMEDVSAVTGRVWAVGDAETILSKSGSNAWTLQRGGPTTVDLLGVSTLSPDEAWAVGDKGAFLHYSSGTWQAVSSAITDTVWAVQMISPTLGYAVGADLIAQWNGTNWTRVAQPFTNGSGLYALAMTGPGEGWAVGSNGYIWHATGGVWSQWPQRPVTQFLLGIAMESPAHGWAVGGYGPGKILEYTGGSWVDRSSTLPAGVPPLQGIITGPGPNEAWAGVWSNNSCSDPALLHYLNGHWSWVSGVTACSIPSFAHEALGELWAAGGIPLYHYSGGAWQSLYVPASIYPFQGISLVPGRGGWAVGPAGQILQYNPLAPGQRYYDVPLTNPFATYIEYMAVHNIVSGYADNTFHPYSDITRAQLTKMVVSGMGWAVVSPASNTFADVPATHPFYAFVETAAAHGVISGYTCGGPGEPCDSQQRPYFRPGNNITRSQLTKVIVVAKGWGTLTPPTPTFNDVPASNIFYGFVEQAVAKGIISGYGCGGPGEPCPGMYFRPAASATRAQLSKILYLALTQP